MGAAESEGLRKTIIPIILLILILLSGFLAEGDWLQITPEPVNLYDISYFGFFCSFRHIIKINYSTIFIHQFYF